MPKSFGPSLSFPVQLMNMPKGFPTGGFLEVGEWDSKHFEVETDVEFYLGDDGYVYARVCRIDEMPNVP